MLPGTFGRPYKVQKGDNFVPVIVKASVPNYGEQEIVIIDLSPPETVEKPEGEKHTSMGELDWYAKASIGLVDPRPRVMARLRDDSDRILQSGGVFVIFAEPRVRQETVLAAFEQLYLPDLRVRQRIQEDNWSILSTLSPRHLKVDSDYGAEIQVTEGLNLLTNFLNRNLKGTTFSASMSALYPLTEKGDGQTFFPLASNKFGETVAGVVVPRKKQEGWVLILPQIKNKEGAVLDLIQNVLPELLPRLFPDHEGGRWVHRDEYEHAPVLERKTAQLEIQRKANEEISHLDTQIVAERKRLGYLHGILTKSGEPLVADMKQALESIGFQKVVDVDTAEGTTVNKQEDLQLHDRSPTVLVEIKGLAGLPTEADTLQVTKYILRRIRQWNRNDVAGIAIVNHQRNLPGLDRDHENVFTRAQIEDAEQNETGLMTTWDLFRLIRGMIQWDWPAEVVKDVMYGKGRLPVLPSHYKILGIAAHFWTERRVVSIDVTNGPLRVGDRVGYLLADGFFEEPVTSLHVNKKAVQEVVAGEKGGMKTILSRREIPVGTPVFRLNNV